MRAKTKKAKPSSKSTGSRRPRLLAIGEELFRLAVEAAPNGMLMVGSDGKIVLANSHCEKLFGYERGELIGQVMEVIVPRRFRASHPGHRAAFFAAPKTRSMGGGRDLFGLRKDGVEVPVEIGLNPIQTDEGHFVLASIIDIMQRRAMEKRLAHSEVLAAIGGMVTVVAHEIRNPLSSIVMAAKALARGGLTPKDQEQVVSVLVGESERLNRTLADFLQSARPREPRKEMGDINAVAREVLTAMRSDAALVGDAVIEEALGEGLPQLHFDADQIRQVIWNIVRNALQALNGKGKVSIATELGAADILVHVKDTGPGIAPDQLEKIFSPFHTTKSKGTGLGLSISRNILLAHGGDIDVQSAPGQGSRFSIVLPLSR